MRSSVENYSLESLCGSDVLIQHFQSPQAKDPVCVVLFENGGLISYLKPEGIFIHTLNTLEGFERKLRQLEIPFSEKEYELWRQDEYGHKFCMKRSWFHTYLEEEMALFEKKGHKQTYWIQSDSL